MKILLSAFACEPNRGSEPGVGWHWAMGLAALGHTVCVLTRTKNKSAIEHEYRMLQKPNNLNFIYYDPPSWILRFEKKDRFPHFFYFLWQCGAYRKAKKIHAREKFDLVHHVTWASVRQPSFMGNLNIPFIFGPVAGGEVAPWRIRFHYGIRGFLLDAIRDIANFFIRLDPLMHRTYQQAWKIYTTSEQTKKLLPPKYWRKTNVQLAIGLNDSISRQKEDLSDTKNPRVLYVGHFLYLKGMGLGLRAFAEFLTQFPNATLTMVGEGPDENKWRLLAKRLKVDDHINWQPWMEMKNLINIYQNHDIFLFPSMHDSGGMVVLEAMANGLPVVCLDLGGPSVTVDDSCGIKIAVDKKSEQQIIDDLSSNLVKIFNNRQLLKTMSTKATNRASKFKWESLINNIYRKIQ